MHSHAWQCHAYPVCGFFEDRARYRVPGIGYRLSGTWDLVPGTGAGPTPRTEHRAPRTEPGHRKTRTPGMHGMAGPVGGAPACPGRGRLWSPPETIERADSTFVSHRPDPLVCPDDLEPIRPHPKLFYPVPPVPSTGLPQFLHSATSQLHPRPHTGFDPGSDPVKEEGYGDSMGDSAVRAPEPGVPLWRRGMGNPPQPC